MPFEIYHAVAMARARYNQASTTSSTDAECSSVAGTSGCNNVSTTCSTPKTPRNTTHKSPLVGRHLYDRILRYYHSGAPTTSNESSFDRPQLLVPIDVRRAWRQLRVSVSTIFISILSFLCHVPFQFHLHSTLSLSCSFMLRSWLLSPPSSMFHVFTIMLTEAYCTGHGFHCFCGRFSQMMKFSIYHSQKNVQNKHIGAAWSIGR